MKEEFNENNVNNEMSRSIQSIDDLANSLEVIRLKLNDTQQLLSDNSCSTDKKDFPQSKGIFGVTLDPFKKRIVQLVENYVEPLIKQQNKYSEISITFAKAFCDLLIGILYEVTQLDVSITEANSQYQSQKNDYDDLLYELSQVNEKIIQQQNENLLTSKKLDGFSEKIDDLSSKLNEFSDAINQVKAIDDENSCKNKLDELAKRYDDSLDILSSHNDRISQLDKALFYINVDYNKLFPIVGDLVKRMYDSYDYDNGIFSEKKFHEYYKITTSQAGEDAIIFYIFCHLIKDLSKVTYLDLGANHAHELSNTFLFYTRGARGVLVEANPDLIPELKFYRHKDIILNKCIDTVSGIKVPFNILNGDGLSTPDKISADEFIKTNPDLFIQKTVEIETITVNDIIDQYLHVAPTILSIDIEGKEVEILKSIDFTKHRPLIIICEMIEYKTSLVVGEKNVDLIHYMKSIDYVEYAFTGINSIFIDKIYLIEKGIF